MVDPEVLSKIVAAINLGDQKQLEPQGNRNGIIIKVSKVSNISGQPDSPGDKLKGLWRRV